MDYDIIAKSYNSLYKEEQINKLKIIKRKLVINKNNKLLDIGCGTTISTNFFKCKTFGVDKSLRMLKEGFGFRVNGAAENLPFKDKSFDIVLCVTSIHNLENTEKAIDEILRIKKKNSQVAITLLKKSKKHQKIRKIIYKKLRNIEEIDEKKDTIFISST